MVDVYNAPPWNNKWTVETTLESLSDISDFPKFFGNVLVDGEKIIGAIIGHIRQFKEPWLHIQGRVLYFYRTYCVVDRYDSQYTVSGFLIFPFNFLN